MIHNSNSDSIIWPIGCIAGCKKSCVFRQWFMFYYTLTACGCVCVSVHLTVCHNFKESMPPFLFVSFSRWLGEWVTEMVCATWTAAQNEQWIYKKKGKTIFLGINSLITHTPNSFIVVVQRKYSHVKLQIAISNRQLAQHKCPRKIRLCPVHSHRPSIQFENSIANSQNELHFSFSIGKFGSFFVVSW